MTTSINEARKTLEDTAEAAMAAWDAFEAAGDGERVAALKAFKDAYTVAGDAADAYREIINRG